MKQFTVAPCVLFFASTLLGQTTCPADPSQLLAYTPWAFQISPGQVPVPTVPAGMFGIPLLAVTLALVLVATRRWRPARLKGTVRVEMALALLLLCFTPALINQLSAQVLPPPVALPVDFTGIGTFKVFPGGALLYNLSLLRTNMPLTRIKDGSGRYLINAECTGGTLFFNNDVLPLQLDFRFGDALLLLAVAPAASVPSYQQHLQQTGLAKPGPAFCPPGVPDDLLIGTNWAFSKAGTLSADTFRINSSQNIQVGLKTYVRTRSNTMVAPGCADGSFGAGPVDWDFVYSGRFDEMFLLDTTNSAGLPFAVGTAKLIQPTTCPADPTQLLQGAPWAFDLTTPGSGNNGGMAVGTFKAFPGGSLQVTETIYSRGLLTPRGQYGGRYSVKSDCSGGTLLFMVNALPLQLDFVFAAPDQLNFATSSNRSIGPYSAAEMAATNVGTAKRSIGTCPVGMTTPADLFGAGATIPYVDSGVIPLGLIQFGGTSTSTPGGPTLVNPNRIALSADCSGGTLSFGLEQWDFVVAGAQPNEVSFLSTTQTPAGVAAAAGTGPIRHCPCDIGHKSW